MPKLALFCACLWFLPVPGRADLMPLLAMPPGMQCRVAVGAAESAHAIPDHLLAASARVESGRRDPQTGETNPWPWTIDADGEGHLYDTKAEAIAAVRAFQARGVQSIDVGCMQINLLHHPDAFASLEQAFDPHANAEYGARFLRELFAQTNAWPKAAAMYHSATPEIGEAYQRRVMAAWPEEQRMAGQVVGPDPAAAAAIRPYGGGFGHFTGSVPIQPVSGGRIIPLPAGLAQIPGRSLADYRAMPVQVSSRMFRPRG